MEALDRAISAFGTQAAFADALGIKSPSVSEWRVRGVIPHDRCAEIERLTGVPRSELRPDLWGEPARPAKKRAA
jgi:DNA-binding transcriptional regulator YdaS (Cro superfamily)